MSDELVEVMARAIAHDEVATANYHHVEWVPHPIDDLEHAAGALAFLADAGFVVVSRTDLEWAVGALPETWAERERVARLRSALKYNQPGESND